MKREEYVKQIQNLRNKRVAKAKPARAVEISTAGVVRLPRETPQIIPISKTINAVHRISSEPGNSPKKGGCGCGRKKR